MEPVVDGLPSVAGASLLLVMLNISSVSSSLSISGSLVSIASIAAAVAAVNCAENDGVVCVSNRDVTAARANGIDVLGEGLGSSGLLEFLLRLELPTEWKLHVVQNEILPSSQLGSFSIGSSRCVKPVFTE